MMDTVGDTCDGVRGPGPHQTVRVDNHLVTAAEGQVADVGVLAAASISLVDLSVAVPVLVLVLLMLLVLVPLHQSLK